MDDLTQLKANLDTTEGQLGQYTSELPSQIEQEYQKAYSPLLKEAAGARSELMSNYLGDIMETTNLGAGMEGTTAYDLSPTQKMGQIGREIGYMGGELIGAQQYADYLGGQMTDMYGKAIQAAQMGQQNLADQYNRQFQLYQMAWQEAENAKNRAATSGGGGGWNFNPEDYLGGGDTGEKPLTYDDILASIKTKANIIASQRNMDRGGASYLAGGRDYGNIESSFKILQDAANSYGLNINPEWLWAQLGNTPSGTYNLPYLS